MLVTYRFLVPNNVMTIVIAVRYQIFPSKNSLAMYPLTPAPATAACKYHYISKMYGPNPKTRSFIIIEHVQATYRKMFYALTSRRLGDVGAGISKTMSKA
jgi:hypothetical protein